MKHFIYILLPLLLLSEGLGTAKYDARYKLGALDTRVIAAEITWEESEWNGVPVYHSSAILRTTPIFRLFLAADNYSETYIRQSDMTPLYFNNPFKKGGKACKFEYFYNPDDGEIESFGVLPKGNFNTSFPNDGRTMDFLTLVHYLRFLELGQVEQPLPLTILVSGKSYPAELSYLGEDPDMLPGIPAEKFLLQLTERGLMENGSGNEVFVWRSIGDEPTILGLEAELSSGKIYVKITNFAQ